MDPIKEAFSKIKEDISSLKEDISLIRAQMSEFTQEFRANQTTPTHNLTNTPLPTDQQTNNQTTPTHNLALESLYTPNPPVSIGNRGVPTDRQTDQQTDRQTNKSQDSSHNLQNPVSLASSTNSLTFLPRDPISEFKRANDILLTLDDIKKEIRLKFKDLTPQEMLVFSTLYALEEQKVDQITYKLIATNLHLSESSIRDYFNKLTKKGVPIEKIRQNNKTITLRISSDLKNITTLATIQRLREL